MEKTNVQATQEKFIAAVERDGLLKVLHTVDYWFSAAAKADIVDERMRQLGEFDSDSEARRLWLQDQLDSSAPSLDSYSTGAGANLAKTSRVAVLSLMLRAANKGLREAAWAAVHARHRGNRKEALYEARKAAAHRAFGVFDFGDAGPEAAGGWESDSATPELRCSFFAAAVDGQANSEKRTFVVRFDGATSSLVAEAYVLLESGDVISGNHSQAALAA